MRRGVRARWWLLVGLLLCLPLVQARDGYSGTDTSIAVIAVSSLPTEARDTLQLIKQGGPFPFPRDGVVFGNYERILPQQARGYYHEYTVKTPGVRHRGARRIVCGIVPARGRPMGSPAKGTPPDTRPPGGPGAAPLLRSDPFALPECYYSDDHYRSFRRIREELR
ncbi:MAG: ribonuclease [Nitrosomonadales bacterium]|nr:ribonuclease [Nitrosomonadales bacterium]